MKTVNGNNKLERKINKAEKYVGVILEEKTNKYLKVVDCDDDNYIYFGEYNIIDTKYGVMVVIDPSNSPKAFWINEYETVHDNNYYGSFVILKANDYNRDLLKRLDEGKDDVFKLKDILDKEDTRTICFSK